MNNATVLLSGGLDSATILALLLSKGYEVSALAFDYGQNHKLELERAEQLCAYYDVSLEVCSLPPLLGASSLITGEAIPVDRRADEIAQGIPSTFVPGRNAVLLSLGASYSAAKGIKYLAIGVNKTDVTGYPDCRPGFIAAFQEVLVEALPSYSQVELLTPLIDKTKAEIVELAVSLGVPLELTSSCYAPVYGEACLRCDACKLRADAFKTVGAVDNVL